MKDVKELFDQAEDGALTYEQFMELAKASNVKLVDLNEGQYVSKNKYESELEAKSKEIATLTGTISTRDTDLETLKKQLEEAGADSTKLTELTNQLQELQGKYDADSKAYKKQLSKQAYEFAVKEFAAKQNFSSQAAKRDFIQSMLAKELKMENDSILGADDFVKAYTENNQDAFILDTDLSDYDDDEEEEYVSESKPQFVSSTPGAEDTHTPDPTGGFLNAFHFSPIRPVPEN
jgi:hypothetical protein